MSTLPDSDLPGPFITHADIFHDPLGPIVSHISSFDDTPAPGSHVITHTSVFDETPPRPERILGTLAPHHRDAASCCACFRSPGPLGSTINHWQLLWVFLLFVAFLFAFGLGIAHQVSAAVHANLDDPNVRRMYR